MTASRTVWRLGPLITVILSLKSGTLSVKSGPLLTQRIGLPAVEAGSKANPVINRAPPLAVRNEVMV